MAKRYYSFEDLSNISGYFKPGHTLGEHHCIVTPQLPDKIIVRGSKEGEVTLTPGDTLGYDRGSVWRVPHPSKYKNPIGRRRNYNSEGRRQTGINCSEAYKSNKGCYSPWRGPGEGTGVVAGKPVATLL